MLAWLLLATTIGSRAAATILDRTAIVVDRQPILESEILRDIRITSFLNGEPLHLDLAARKVAANRLIDQELIRRQTRTGGYSAPQAETDRFFAQVEHDRFATAAQFQRALSEYGITASELREELSWQLTVLRFIDTRFRPQVVVSDSDIQQYYQAHRAEFVSKPLVSARGEITETITGQRINQLLDDWLKQERKSVRITYLEKSLA